MVESNGEFDNWNRFAVPVWHRVLAQKIDDVSVVDFGIADSALMETAGRAAANEISEKYGHSRKCVLLIGCGNNGGDALVVARTLVDKNVVVQCLFVAESFDDKMSLSCSSQLDTVRKLKIPVELYFQGALERKIDEGYTLLVDGVFGLGFKGDLKPGLARDCILEMAKASEKKDISLVALDLPSGLDADCSSPVPETPLHADTTVTFGDFKPVHLLAPFKKYCGNVRVCDIGFPSYAVRRAFESINPLILRGVTESIDSLKPFSGLPEDANKFDRGHVLILGGSKGKLGALNLCSRAALRSGAGWVTLSAPKKALEESLKLPFPTEATFEEFYEDEVINTQRVAEFCLTRKVRAIVVGPGAVSNPLPLGFLSEISKRTTRKLVVIIDAGALSKGLMDELGTVQGNHIQILLTPHPGEWKRVFGDGVQHNYLEMAKILEQKLGPNVTCIYKSATPLVFASNIPACLALSGSENGLAKAGSGDVFAGICSALACTNLPLWLNAAKAYSILTRCLKIAGLTHGKQSVLATDLIDNIHL